jgi:uncharacterized membrane protein YdbT with pleckstrin-like domain
MTENNTAIQDPPSDFGIRLMDDEEVLLSLRPYRFVRYAVISSACTIIGIVFIPLAWIWALIAQHRYHYWLTNRRVIWCHGFIGYQVRSVPLERIADVGISRSLVEMLSGMSSIDIRDMTGQTQIRHGVGAAAGAKWIGVENSPEVQKRILEQVRIVNERSKNL